jgi:predicted metal-dependent hydrolase
MTRPGKKKPEEIKSESLREMEMNPEDWEELERGIDLFNSGKFWHAHEAWELVWQRHHEDERLFLQGLIQLAAAYHLLVTGGSYRGMLGNFEKARTKLRVFRPEYLGVPVEPLLDALEQSVRLLTDLGAAGMRSFDRTSLPKMQFHKPNNPDLLVEVRDVIRSDAFQEGIRLFNEGYFWEAHEAWEGVQRGELADARPLVQAFSQLASACNMLKLRKIDSARYLLEKAVRVFQAFEHVSCDMPLGELGAQIQSTITAIDLHRVDSGGNGKPLRLPGIRLRLQKNLVE